MPIFGPNIKKMKEKADIQGLIKELKAKNPEIRIEVVKVLSELKHVEGLSEAIRNDDPKVCIEATRALVELKCTDELLGVLRNNNLEVRVEAIKAVKDVGDPKTIEPLSEVLTTDTVEAVQRKAFEALSSFGIEDPETWISMATKLLKSGSYEIALNCLEKAVQIKPEDKEMIGSIGVGLTDYGRYEDALRYSERFIEIDPMDARGWGLKGVCLDNLGKEEEALRCCKKALEIDSKLKGARDTLGAIYYNKGDYEALVSLAQETLRFAPEDIKAHVMMAEALMLLDKLNEAKAQLEESLKALHQQEWMEAQDLGMIHQELGILHVMRGEKELTLVDFQKAYDSSRDDWDYQLKESCELLDVLGLILKGRPQDRRGRLLGLAHQRAKAREEGYQSYAEKIIARAPVDKIYQLADDVGSNSDLVEAMLKFWSQEHFTEFVRIHSRSEVEALIRNVEGLFVSPNKESARRYGW